MDNDKIEPLTIILTGLFQISISDNDDVMVFAGYSDNGWDIFRLANPMDMNVIEINPTQFIKDRRSGDELLVDFRRNKSTGMNTNRTSGRDYSNYIFAPEYKNYNQNNHPRFHFI